MQVQQIPMKQFLDGQDKMYVIPVYQRDYAWTRNNCKKLWDDLIDIKKYNRKSHFLGTIVAIVNDHKYNEYTIIDGQQRITTICLFLLALHKYVKDNPTIHNSEFVPEKILDLLTNKYSPDQNKRIRLKPNKQDKDHFEALFNTNTPEVLDSNIVSNYRYFYERISLNQLSPVELFEIFEKLTIVLITLHSGEDDPQLIFESLNSTGVNLTAGDLIRNFVLMNLNPQDQESFYKNYWVPVEQLTGNVAEFIRYYLTYHKQASIKRDDVYETFKMFTIDHFNGNTEALLQEMVSFAKMYSYLVQINPYPQKEIQKRLDRLYKLEVTVTYAYLFDVLKELEQGNISENMVIKILDILESYVFRRMIIENSTTGLNNFFATLTKEIKQEAQWKDDYINILSYVLLEKRATQAFPNNENFVKALVNKEIYLLNSKNKLFLLESLENYNSSYAVDIESLTIEHIMPQKLTSKWKAILGEKWEETHKKYVHTLGNLSLTAKNSSLSNNSFEDKQRIDFQTSKLRLNYALDNVQEWNEFAIINRAQKLANDALAIWEYPTTTFSKPVPEEQKYDLSTDESFSNIKLSRLYFGDDETGVEIDSWRELLKRVCKYLYEYSPTIFTQIMESHEFKRYFDTSKDLLSPVEFERGKVVMANLSANDIVSLIQRLCEHMGYPPEYISFSIKNK